MPTESMVKNCPPPPQKHKTQTESGIPTGKPKEATAVIYLSQRNRTDMRFDAIGEAVALALCQQHVQLKMLHGLHQPLRGILCKEYSEGKWGRQNSWLPVECNRQRTRSTS